ncbi:ABC transporter, ATP-binding protein [Selenomonas sp. FOBRC6]|uniref:ABC-F family ATP-binding cassette domain-containing protein n=1 Tax=Selenomonas sp. FOBRC6 TaxID=936572 RepID=UPI000277EF77|nr:ABC-F family ATP-binding cassette domain-containing protein [Selenomonas sp. FOBRC6]EJO23814.1 ABC transporter, ATP-binding protein [Selenomonas sp. FOBRC6]
MGSLKVIGLEKAYGIRTLFSHVNFEVQRGDKVGLVGANGTGKTTLMRLLLGREESDGGQIVMDRADTVGYVEQQAAFSHDTLYDELRSAFSDLIALRTEKERMEHDIASGAAGAEELAAYGNLVTRFEAMDGYDFESRIRRVAFGLGFSEADLAKDVRHFSGGQTTRICLAKALLREPDFLFLDEPTNHLDIGMIEWLEKFLQSYRGGVLLISHDRYFLDRVATRILELDHAEVTAYTGNYTHYMRVKNDRRAALQSAYEKQQAQIKKTEEYISRYRAGIKAKQARGRQSQLNRLERIVLPPEAARFKYFAFTKPTECAQRVAELEDITFAYPGGQRVLDRISLLIRKGDGVALIGENGVGKTTLLQILVGELEASGRLKIGSRVKIGYFSQQHEGLDPSKTILDEICYTFGLDEETARNYLGAFLFHGDDVQRLIGALSGGEQARVAFLKLMLTGANFLVLDEPTNHLDIPAREAVEEALMAFPGTFIAVSHDRYFLDKTANCTLELRDGKITEYLGNYSYYLMKKEAEAEEAAEARSAEKAERSPSPVQEEKPREEKMPPKTAVHSAIPAARRQEMLERTEAEIAMAEAELKGLEYEMNRPETQLDPERSREIAEAYAAKELEIMQRYEKWEQLTEA